MKIRTQLLFTVALFLCFCFCVLSAKAQNKYDYKTECFKLYNNINKNQYDEKSGLYVELPGAEDNPKPFAYLWPLTCLYQTANELEAISSSKKYMSFTWNCIKKYEDPTPPALGYSSYIITEKDSRYYDDNQWIGIAALDAYFRTKNKKYFTIGENIYKFMMTGFDTLTGGGLYWREDKKESKNTCSNGPGILIALQMYKATKQQPYLDTALMLYHWTNKTLQMPNGLYYDNIDVASGKIQKWVFSYNTGTMLQSNVYLYEITGEQKYLQEATRIADNAIDYFCNKKFRDNYWFTAVLLRGYQQLLQHHYDAKYVAAFKQCTDNVLENNMNENGLVGKEKPVGLVQQAGIVEILARLVEIDKKYSK